MSTITLQFSTNNSIGARLIRWFTWSEYSHVDFVLEDGRLLGAQSDGVFIRKPNNHYTKVQRVSVEAPASVLKHARSQIGKPYDYGGIFGIILRRNWHDPKRWFCSEYVAWAFKEAKAPLLRTERANRITPRDLLLSPLLMGPIEKKTDHIKHL